MPNKGLTPRNVHRRYRQLLAGISGLLEQARRTAVRSVNAVLTSAYWQIGQRIVEHEQHGTVRAEYGRTLMQQLARDLTARHGRGFSIQGLYKMRGFYLGWEILPTPSGEFEAKAKLPTVSGESTSAKVHASSREQPIVQTLSARSYLSSGGVFPLSWSHYIRLLAVDNPQARAVYESEAIRGGWSVRQLDRQISTQFFERTALSKNPTALMARGQVARQKRIRVGDEWYRIDLLLFHRRLRCLVVIDLKVGKFTHADAGQMNLYLNYMREHMMEPGENDPVGPILCSAKNDAVVHYAMGGIKAKVFASHYLTALPDPETLRQEIMTTQRAIEARRRVE